MRYTKKKIFWKPVGSSEKQVDALLYDEQKDYYGFIREQMAQNYHHVTITSEMMAEFISAVLSVPSYRIDDVQMMEEDEELSDQITDAIRESGTGTMNGRFALMKVIRDIAEKSSIEIKRITMSGKNSTSGNAEMFFVQSNGLIGVTSGDSELERQLLILVKEHLEK